MNDLLLSASHLSKRFGDTQAVADLSVSLQAGELFGLVGPDGAGKTTAIRLLCRALQPDTGDVSICGIALAEQPDRARENIGYLSQRFSLYEDLTVLENIRFFAEVRGLTGTDWQPRAMEILEFVGLAPFAARSAGQLSGGMKQKLGLASALVHRPRLLLLDEPTGGVDPVTRQDFWQLIIRLVAQEKVGVLVSTPYMDEASRCSRVGIISQGHLLMEGTPAALRAQLDGRILEVRGEPLAAIRAAANTLPDVEDVQAFGDRLHVRVRPDHGAQAKAALQAAADQYEFAIRKLDFVAPQLEDVFIAASARRTDD